jgi:hypothetical protein
MSNKSNEIEAFLNELSLAAFGRARSVSIAGQGCVSCGKPADKFRDELSRKEFQISGLCQDCQDKTFGVFGL